MFVLYTFGCAKIMGSGLGIDSYHGPAVRCEFAESGHRLRQEECLYFTVALSVDDDCAPDTRHKIKVLFLEEK